MGHTLGMAMTLAVSGLEKDCDMTVFVLNEPKYLKVSEPFMEVWKYRLQCTNYATQHTTIILSVSLIRFSKVYRS